MSKIQEQYDIEFVKIEKRVKKICNLNTSLRDEPEIVEMMKCWAMDIASLKLDIEAEQIEKEHFRKQSVTAHLELSSFSETNDSNSISVRCINPKNSPLKTDKIYQVTESKYFKDCYILDVGWNLVLSKDIFEVIDNDSPHEA